MRHLVWIRNGWVTLSGYRFLLLCVYADLDGDSPTGEELKDIGTVPLSSAGSGSAVGSVPIGMVSPFGLGGMAPQGSRTGLGVPSLLVGCSGSRLSGNTSGPVHKGQVYSWEKAFLRFLTK